LSGPEPPLAPGPGPHAQERPGPAAPSGSGPGQAAIIGLRSELADDIARIEGEDAELSLLAEQVLAEIERHQGRRSRLEAELSALETDTNADPAEVTQLRDALLALTRRELLFDAQRQVLEGKQRVLARFLQRIVEIDGSLGAMAGGASRPAPTANVGLRPLAGAAGAGGPADANQPALVMRSQEDLRRDIVRQLHDGPAQSLANIGLQAEIVERLVQKGDSRAMGEIEALRRLVQQALDTTKEFIFEIRPMVLDDLGLAPTLRRAAGDRGRRAGIPVEFESRGVEERLDPDVESALYRSVDEAVAAYLELRPPSVLIRLDWGERELVASVETLWPRATEAAADASQGSQADTPPALLAMMEEKRTADRAANLKSRALAPERIEPIRLRASALGLKLTMRSDGQVMELLAPVHR
jgi:two-component system, NarL family, sensor histidine kinase DegS